MMLDPTPLPLLVRHAQWIVAGEVQAVLAEAPPAPGVPGFFGDQVLRVRVRAGLKDTRPWPRLLWERGTILVHKPYNARRLAPGDAGIFFLTRNTIPAHGGAPYDLPARRLGFLEVGLSQPYRLGDLLAPWVSNGRDAPLDPARVAEVRTVRRTI